MKTQLNKINITKQDNYSYLKILKEKKRLKPNILYSNRPNISTKIGTKMSIVKLYFKIVDE